MLPNLNKKKRKIYELIRNKYYTFLNVGFPPQKTEAQLSTQEVGLTMEENICLTSNYYNTNKN